MMHWMTRLALELLGQGGLGHSFDSLDDAKPNLLAEDLKALMYVLYIPYVALVVL